MADLKVAKNGLRLNQGSMVEDPKPHAHGWFEVRSTPTMRGGTISPTPDLRTWLPWVIKIRFVIVTLIFAIEYGLAQIVPDPGHWVSIKHLGVVAIILASVLLPRPRAFLVAAVCFVCMGIMLELAYLPSLYPQFVRRYLALDFLASSSLAPADTGTLEVKILASLLGFFAVTYLSTHLAE